MSLAALRPPSLPRAPDPKMAAPSGRRNGGGGASLWAALLLAAVALRPAETVSEPTMVAFDVRPGGVVHSFSQNVGPGVRVSTTPGDGGMVSVTAGSGDGVRTGGADPGEGVEGWTDGVGPEGERTGGGGA